MNNSTADGVVQYSIFQLPLRRRGQDKSLVKPLPLERAE